MANKKILKIKNLKMYFLMFGASAIIFEEV